MGFSLSVETAWHWIGRGREGFKIGDYSFIKPPSNSANIGTLFFNINTEFKPHGKHLWTIVNQTVSIYGLF